MYKFVISDIKTKQNKFFVVFEILANVLLTFVITKILTIFIFIFIILFTEKDKKWW